MVVKVAMFQFDTLVMRTAWELFGWAIVSYVICITVLWATSLLHKTYVKRRTSI